MRLEYGLHLGGAGFENFNQAPMAAVKILQHVSQLPSGGLRLRPKSLSTMVCLRSVERVEVPRFNCRSEGAHHDPSRIRAQMQGLAVEKLGLRQSFLSESAMPRRIDARLTVSISVLPLRDP